MVFRIKLFKILTVCVKGPLAGYPKSEFIVQKACWRVHVAVRDQMSICGVVWTTAVHIMPTRKPPALDASVEATKRLVEAAAR